MTTINFPSFNQPPLTANQRMHWRKKADITSRVRSYTARLAAAQLEPLEHCTVALTWYVATKHRRDVDNIVPTLKAMCDGLVDAGIVPDDTPNLMDKEMPRIVYIGPGTIADQYMTLEVREHRKGLA